MYPDSRLACAVRYQADLNQNRLFLVKFLNVKGPYILNDLVACCTKWIFFMDPNLCDD